MVTLSTSTRIALFFASLLLMVADRENGRAGAGVAQSLVAPFRTDRVRNVPDAHGGGLPRARFSIGEIERYSKFFRSGGDGAGLWHYVAFSGTFLAIFGNARHSLGTLVSLPTEGENAPARDGSRGLLELLVNNSNLLVAQSLPTVRFPVAFSPPAGGGFFVLTKSNNRENF